MSEITRNEAIRIVEDIRTAISAGSVTNTMEAQVLEYCVVVLGRSIEEASQSGSIVNLPDVVAFLAGISSSTTLRELLSDITGKIPSEASSLNKLADKAFVTTAINGLQNALNNINTNIGNGYVYAGIATPSVTPVSGKVFYLARQAGQYTNFGGLTVTEGINILKRNGSAWSQEQLMSMADIYKNPLIGYYECDTAGDTAAKTVTAAGYVLPTTGGSMKIKMANRNTVANATLNINSTGAKPLYYNGQRASADNTWDTNEVIEVFYDGTNYQAHNVAGCNGDGVFDISAYNLTNGQPTPYEDLEAALGPDGEHVPPSLRKGGVNIKFVQSPGSKYVQYRLTADEFTTDTTKWAIYSEIVYTENPEFVEVKTDSEDKILEAIKKDGTKVIGGDLQVHGQIINRHIQRQIDSAIKQKMGDLDTDALSSITTIENPEWLSVTTDEEGKVLGGRKPDGAVKECISLEVPILKVGNKIIGKLSEFEKVKITGSLELTDDIIKGILSNNINDGSVKALYPKYEWEGYIANLATTKNLGAYNDRTYKPLVLQHFSDIHNSAIGCKRAIEFYNMYKEYIADVLLSGDMAGSDWTVYSPAMYELDGYNDILKVIGNHDVVLHYGQPGAATEEDCYQRYMEGIENWGVNYIENKCYWYKDYIHNTGTKDHFNGEPYDSSKSYEQSAMVTYENKFYKASCATGNTYFRPDHWEEITTFGIRLIGYDFEHQTEEQFSWLSQVLSDAITKGVAVILVTHGTPYIDDTTAEFFDTPFDGDEWLQKGVIGCASFRLVEIVSNFIDNGGEFICYLAGHIHTDKCGCFKTGTMVVDNVTYTNNHKQVFIAVGLARCDLTPYDYEATGQSEIDIQKIPYSKTWDLFNLESFDTETKTISVLRVGADIDRLLRSRRSMVILYQNCELLYTR